VQLVILDRDGVINQDSDQFIKSPAEWIAIPGSLEAISLLNQHRYTVAIATNQSGISRGYFSEDTLHSMHDKMASLLKPLNGWVDAIYYCPHGPNDDCLCRKPKPGLYQQIAQQFNADLTKTIVVGDSYRDLQAAIAVNAKPILVRTGKGKNTINERNQILIDHEIPIFDNLKAVVRDLITNKS